MKDFTALIRSPWAFRPMTLSCLVVFLLLPRTCIGVESPSATTSSLPSNLPSGEPLPLVSSLESEQAPHGQGNLYAPEVHRGESGWIMWYGAQGKDGHDRIHAASSKDGKVWRKHGVVIDCETANHVNDPTVARAGGKWWMFYTLATMAEDDQIAAASSEDGLQWHLHGIVIRPGSEPAWDSRKVGRPSVLFEGGRFRLWYDGQPTETAIVRNTTARSTAQVGRAIGYAESPDGLQWQRRDEPVWISGAGAIHVSRVDSTLVMVYESHAGTQWAVSDDGYKWNAQGSLAAKQGDDEASGHVTPYLFVEPRARETLERSPTSALLFYGAASRPSWNFNRIAVRSIPRPVSHQP